jgi:hypothetical protein
MWLSSKDILWEHRLGKIQETEKHCMDWEPRDTNIIYIDIYNLHVVDFFIFFHVYQREVEHVDILLQTEEEQETEKFFMD